MSGKANLYTGAEEREGSARLFTMAGLGDVLNSIAQAVADRGGFGGSRNAIAHFEHNGDEHRCPWCQGDVYRVRRRMADRFASVISPRQRYRCMSFGCRWEGTLRIKR